MSRNIHSQAGSRYNDPNSTRNPNFRVGVVTLQEGSPQGLGCGSCHRAHGGQDGKFLRVSNAYSHLCRNCHTN